MSNQAGRYQRTFPGLIGALAVLVAVVLVFVVVRGLVREDLETPIREVDYASSLGFFESEAGFEILAPPALPSGWVATSARVEPGPPTTWHLGILTDTQQYVGLEQARDTEQSMVNDYVDEDAVQGDVVDVAGEPWTSYTDAGGDTALVRTEGDLTTLVVGTVSLEELVAFAASLR